MLLHATINFICKRDQISEKFSWQNISFFPSYFCFHIILFKSSCNQYSFCHARESNRTKKWSSFLSFRSWQTCILQSQSAMYEHPTKNNVAFQQFCSGVVQFSKCRSSTRKSKLFTLSQESSIRSENWAQILKPQTWCPDVPLLVALSLKHIHFLTSKRRVLQNLTTTKKSEVKINSYRRQIWEIFLFSNQYDHA